MENREIRLKRIQDPVEKEDGRRVLVDRLWPRGIRKEAAALDDWPKELAPSRALRRWFHQDRSRWEAFRESYRRELSRQPEALNALLEHCRQGRITLLFGSRDRSRNQAVVLREVLLEELAEEDRPGENASPVCFSPEYPTDD